MTWIALGLSIPATFLRAWVLTLLWAWFVSPLGVVEIGLWQAIGISTFVTLLTFHQLPNSERDPAEQSLVNVFTWLVLSLVCLGMGFIAHGAMI